LLILAVQAAISFLPGRLDWRYRLPVALAAFPILGSLVAAIYGWISHYWS